MVKLKNTFPTYPKYTKFMGSHTFILSKEIVKNKNYPYNSKLHFMAHFKYTKFMHKCESHSHFVERNSSEIYFQKKSKYILV